MSHTERMMAAALEGQFHSLPDVDPWAPKYSAPELTNIKPVLALPRANMKTPDRDFLHVASDDMRTFNDRRITLHGILMAVSVATQIPMNDIRSPRRSRNIVAARHVYFWIARNYTGKSFPAIGKFCGKMDHSSVMHGIHKVNEMMPQFSGAIARAMAILNYEKRG